MWLNAMLGMLDRILEQKKNIGGKMDETPKKFVYLIVMHQC